MAQHITSLAPPRHSATEIGCRSWMHSKYTPMTLPRSYIFLASCIFHTP